MKTYNDSRLLYKKIPIKLFSVSKLISDQMASPELNPLYIYMMLVKPILLNNTNSMNSIYSL